MRSDVVSGWWLSIDFGTSNTAAAVVDVGTGAVRVVALAHTGNLMPSSVFVDMATDIAVGEVALNRASTLPSAFIAAPKRFLTLGHDSFHVAGSAVPARHVVAAVLRAVVTRAQGQQGRRPPSGIILTHPEGWSPRQVGVLIDGAQDAGFGAQAIRTVSEPRAATQYYAGNGDLFPGDRVVVFDFGGGTVDVAVLEVREHGAFEVIAAQGDNALGGRNFDAAIRRWVDQHLADTHPELLVHLQEAASTAELRALDEAIRRAKEVMSEAPSAVVEISAGGRQAVLSLTRHEFEGLIERDIARATALTRTTMQAPAGDSRVRAIYLTGGSSRIPLVHRMIGELGPIATLDDPKTVVAQGAALSVWSSAVPAAPRQPEPAPVGWPGVSNPSAPAQPPSPLAQARREPGAPSEPQAQRQSVETTHGWSLRTRGMVLIGAVAAVVATVAAVVLLKGAPDRATAAPKTPVAAESIGDPAPADGWCPAHVTGNRVVGSGPGDLTSEAGVILRMQYAYYVQRDPAAVRNLLTPDAQVAPEQATRDAISALPAGTRHCVTMTPLSDGQWDTTVDERRPGTAPTSWRQTITVKLHNGQPRIYSIVAAS